MDQQLNKIHHDFRLNGIPCNSETLFEIAYSLIKEGEDYELPIGDFLMDWLADDTSVTVSTSGSTGIPKIIELQKEHMIHSAQATAGFFHLPPKIRALLCLSTQSIAGKMMLVRAMTLGWHLDLVPPSSRPLLGLEQSYDFCAMVPMQLRNSLEEIDRIKTLIIGGAPLSEELKQLLSNSQTTVYETYGMTETCSHIALRPIHIPGVDIEEEAKEVFTALPGISLSQDDRGCLIIHAPDISEPDVVTNDLVELRSENTFLWLGRWDNVVNSGGIKLIPEAIEKKMASTINQRFVLLGLPDKVLGEKLVLLVEGKGSKDILMKNLRSLQDLQSYEIPKEIYYLEQFPETPGGKIRRSGLSELIKERDIS